MKLFYNADQGDKQLHARIWDLDVEMTAKFKALDERLTANEDLYFSKASGMVMNYEDLSKRIFMLEQTIFELQQQCHCRFIPKEESL